MAVGGVFALCLPKTDLFLEVQKPMGRGVGEGGTVINVLGPLPPGNGVSAAGVSREGRYHIKKVRQEL